jgi:hypothetical protein
VPVTVAQCLPVTVRPGGDREGRPARRATVASQARPGPPSWRLGSDAVRFAEPERPRPGGLASLSHADGVIILVLLSSLSDSVCHEAASTPASWRQTGSSLASRHCRPPSRPRRAGRRPSHGNEIMVPLSASARLMATRTLSFSALRQGYDVRPSPSSWRRRRGCRTRTVVIATLSASALRHGDAVGLSLASVKKLSASALHHDDAVGPGPASW